MNPNDFKTHQIFKYYKKIAAWGKEQDEDESLPYASLLAQLYEKQNGSIGQPASEVSKFYSLSKEGIATVKTGDSKLLDMFSREIEAKQLFANMSNREEQKLQMEPPKRSHKVTLEQKSFFWLLEKLLPPNDKVLGCELWVPDTALFEAGRPKLVVKTDSNSGCLVKYKKLPSLTDLRKILPAVSRERKKDVEQPQETSE
jgi:hypothetical protein